MGQSQPASQPPIECPVINHRVCGDPEQLLQSTLIRKLGNHKMVSNDCFKTFIETSNHESNRIYKSQVYNDLNCSIYERKLPDELFIQILTFLHNREIIKFGRVCKNWKYYWVENIELWRGRSFGGDDIEPFVFFKPILETPMKSIAYYYNEFMPGILNSFSKSTGPQSTFMVCKFVLAGFEKCGKSELRNMVTIADHKFDEKYSTTIAIELGVKTFHCNNNQVVKMQVWDCSGSAIYSSVCSPYIRGSRIAIYCFDLSDENSFTKMQECVQEFLTEHCLNRGDISINECLKCAKKSLIIIGMKRDLERHVSSTQVGKYVSELVPECNNGVPMNDLKVQYFELSSKTDAKKCLLFPFLYGLVLAEEPMIEEKRDELPTTA